LPTPRRRRRGLLRSSVAVAVAVALFAVWGALLGGSLAAQEIISPSMSPTIGVSDRILARRLSPEAPVRIGDIVVIAPPDRVGLPLVKRVAAGPGDEVWTIGSHVWINRAPRREDVEAIDPALARRVLLSHFRLGRGQYFVLGDNREDSLDSTTFGPVRREDISHRALFRYAPLRRAGAFAPAPGEFPLGSRHFAPG
jgi:signal peptidase I